MYIIMLAILLLIVLFVIVGAGAAYVLSIRTPTQTQTPSLEIEEDLTVPDPYINESVELLLGQKKIENFTGMDRLDANTFISGMKKNIPENCSYDLDQIRKMIKLLESGGDPYRLLQTENQWKRTNDCILYGNSTPRTKEVTDRIIYAILLNAEKRMETLGPQLKKLVDAKDMSGIEVFFKKNRLNEAMFQEIVVLGNRFPKVMKDLKALGKINQSLKKDESNYMSSDKKSKFFDCQKTIFEILANYNSLSVNNQKLIDSFTKRYMDRINSL
jgi:hypothetical protein